MLLPPAFAGCELLFLSALTSFVMFPSTFNKLLGSLFAVNLLFCTHNTRAEERRQIEIEHVLYLPHQAD
jgi:hypothetical protein